VNPNERHIIDELQKGTTPLPSDDYFARLKSDLLSKTEPAKVVPFYRKRRAIATAAAAASVVLIVTFLLHSGQPAAPVAEAPDWNSVSREEVLAYIDEHIDDFEAETIAAELDSLPDSNIAETDTLTIARTSTAETKYDELFDGIEKEDILEYLQEEATEIDDELLLGS
jgi:hypothetical protein